MRSEVYGNSSLPGGEGIVYSLLCDEAETAGLLGCEFYGVQVEMGDEMASRPRLTASRASVGALLDKLVRGCVTPVSLTDIVDDWLVQ